MWWLVWMLLLLPLTVLSAVTDGRTAEPSDPNISWECGDEEIVVSFSTSSPFEGSLMTAGGSRNECSVHGKGNTTTNLSISLIDLDLCNVTYDQVLDKYSVRVSVRSHPKLLLDSDRFYDISCQRPRQLINQPTPETRFRVSFEEETSENIKDLIFGRPYTVSVHQMSANPQPFLVTRCSVRGNSNLSATVLDSRGCPRGASLLGPFARSSDNAVSTSKIPSMFRFPSTSTLTFECAIQICGSDQSCRPPCFGNANFQEKDKVRSLLDTAEVEEDADDDLIWVSTTVTVREEGTPKIAAERSDSGLEVMVPMKDGSQPCSWKDGDHFVYACAILGAGFVLGTLFNLLICCIWMRRQEKKREKKAHHRRRMDTDYWIAEPAQTITKNVSAPQPGYYEVSRRLSNASYASVKNRPIRPAPPVPNRDYGVPPPSVHTSIHASQLSDYAGSRASSDGKEYASCGVTGSTFLSHSTTVETDLDSPGSNQTVSYH